MKISRSALLPYSAQQMYDVVADIAAYPEFLNWCTATQILEQSDAQVIARLVIAYGKLNIQFVTRNTNKIGESITLDLVEGPFTRLHGQWNFLALRHDACKVSLDMRFDFDLSLSQHVVEKLFSTIISNQLEAFQNRAIELYGNNRHAHN